MDRYIKIKGKNHQIFQNLVEDTKNFTLNSSIAEEKIFRQNIMPDEKNQ